MSEVVERLIEQKKKEWQQEAWSGGHEEGREKGHLEEKQIMVRNAVKMGLSIDAIAQLTGLSEKEIREVEANAQKK